MDSDLAVWLQIAAVAGSVVVGFVVWRKDSQARDRAMLKGLADLSDQIRRMGERSGREHKELMETIRALHERIMTDNAAHAASHAKIETMIEGLKEKARANR